MIAGTAAAAVLSSAVPGAGGTAADLRNEQKAQRNDDGPEQNKNQIAAAAFFVFSIHRIYPSGWQIGMQKSPCQLTASGNRERHSFFSGFRANGKNLRHHSC